MNYNLFDHVDIDKKNTNVPSGVGDIESLAKEYDNPLAVKYILAKMHPCVAALTQMQGADDSNPNYYVYADYWREHKCKTEDFPQERIQGDKMKKDLFALIGKDKAAVQKIFGKEPTIYEHPSEHREVLTYKQAETFKTGGKVIGAKGEFESYYTDEVHYVFTLDRGVVTKVQRFLASYTNGQGETTVRDYDKLRQQEQEQKQKNKGQMVIGRSGGKVTIK